MNTENTIEELVLENNKDTFSYTFSTYYDKNKPKYNKSIIILGDEPSSDSRYEEYYYYDNNGNNTKKIHHDLNTGQREETYKFNDTDYKEAVNLVQLFLNFLFSINVFLHHSIKYSV